MINKIICFLLYHKFEFARIKNLRQTYGRVTYTTQVQVFICTRCGKELIR